MNILVVVYEYPPVGGGGGFVARGICEYLAGEGHGITVITSHFRGLEKSENVNGVEVIRVPVAMRRKLEVASLPSMLSYAPAGILRGMRILKQRRFDVIHTHFAIPSGPSGYVLSKLFHIPDVLSLHGGDVYDPSKSRSPHRTFLLFQTVRAMMNAADRLVAQSTDTRDNARRYYGIKREIDVIPLGIRPPSFVRRSRRELALEPDEFVFCTVGRLIRRKNLEESLLILAELKDLIRFRFVIIGEGPERPTLERLSRRLGIQDSVLMPGNVSDAEKFQLLSVSDCYISTALHEGFGLVFLEAMESGLPVVCYNRGGQRDFLKDGQTGFLVELGDRKTFKERLLELARDPGSRERIARANRELVKRYYIGECAGRYLTLFREATEEYRRRHTRGG